MPVTPVGLVCICCSFSQVAHNGSLKIFTNNFTQILFTMEAKFPSQNTQNSEDTIAVLLAAFPGPGGVGGAPPRHLPRQWRHRQGGLAGVEHRHPDGPLVLVADHAAHLPVWASGGGGLSCRGGGGLSRLGHDRVQTEGNGTEQSTCAQGFFSQRVIKKGLVGGFKC